MSEPLTGQQIGVYDLQAPLGAGGMGVVYRALDTRLNRTVATKFVSDEIADAAGLDAAQHLSHSRAVARARTVGDAQCVIA